MNRQGRPAAPTARAMEIHASSREMAFALEFGGELGERKARAIVGHILRDAQAIQRDLDKGRAA